MANLQNNPSNHDSYDIQELRQRIEGLEYEIRAIRNSRSWKLALVFQKIFQISKVIRQPSYFFQTRVRPRLLKRQVSNFEKLKLSDLVPAQKFAIKFVGSVHSRGDWSSEIVSEKRFKEDNFFKWMDLLRELPKLHNKQFQQYAIMESANRITSDIGKAKKAIGFGVGVEPIPAALVKLGFDVLATDYLDGSIAEDWKRTGQLASEFQQLNQRGILTEQEFIDHLKFQNLDMNQSPKEMHGSFDFTWSSCALGHIGGYQNGLDFILDSLNLLRPGGMAVHSTELDVSALGSIFTSPSLNFYKLDDLNETIKLAQKRGFETSLIQKRKMFSGKSERFVVLEPWDEKTHIRIEIFGREILSVVLIFRKPND